MSLLANNLRRAVVLAFLAGAVSSTSAFGGDNSQNKKFDHHRSNVADANGKSQGFRSGNGTKVVPFENGNTGFTGIGKPQASRPAKVQTTTLKQYTKHASPKNSQVVSSNMKKVSNSLLSTTVLKEKATNVILAKKPVKKLGQKKVTPTGSSTPVPAPAPAGQPAPTGNGSGNGGGMGPGTGAGNGTGGGKQPGGWCNGWGGGFPFPVPFGLPFQPVSYPVYSAPAPAYYETSVQYTSAAPAVVEAGSVDLVLEDVKMVEDATAVAGPAYSIRFRNQGLQTSAKFVVAAVASLDGQLISDAPRAVLEVPGLAAGEMRELVLRLPASALKMGAEQTEFSFLVVLIDVSDTVQESDETNNAAVLERVPCKPAESMLQVTKV